ncbi:MAG: 3-deoxy-manno-octulosonate cytidylyltransferase [Candidatus Omnitrophica bacterium]|nr:3-deoxy-manno-octulosonate cytidylyltransferase [Candidatus Omnitrophota bacterium]
MSNHATPRTVAIIPARLESSRLPKKPLADICGLPMIVHVLRRSQMAKTLHDVYVATDSAEILETVQKFGGKAIMTNSRHQTGTDRIAEAAAGIEADIIVNVQGDEALLDPEHIDAAVTALYQNPDLSVALLVTPFAERGITSVIKTVLNEKDEVMYFSRSDIPSDARTPNPPLLKVCHLVPFRKSFLLQYAAWTKGKLETIEFNEYLRILEKGYKIKAVHIPHATVSVDTPQDLELIRSQMPQDRLFKTYFEKLTHPA